MVIYFYEVGWRVGGYDVVVNGINVVFIFFFDENNKFFFFCFRVGKGRVVAVVDGLFSEFL